MKKVKVFTPCSLRDFMEREVIVRTIMDVESSDKRVVDVTVTLFGCADGMQLRATLRGHLRRRYPTRPTLSWSHDISPAEVLAALVKENDVLCRTSGGVSILNREERAVTVRRYPDGRIEDGGSLLVLLPYYGWFAAALMGEYREHGVELRPFGAQLYKIMDRFLAFVDTQAESATKELRKLA